MQVVEEYDADWKVGVEQQAEGAVSCIESGMLVEAARMGGMGAASV